MGYIRRWARFSTKIRSLYPRQNRVLCVYQKNFRALSGVWGYEDRRVDLFGCRLVVVNASVCVRLCGLRLLQGQRFLITGVVWGLVTYLFRDNWLLFVVCAFTYGWRRGRVCRFC